MPDQSQDKIEEARISLKRNLKVLHKHDAKLECFKCKKHLGFMYMYKCYWCGQYFCPACAREHFEQKDLYNLLYFVWAHPKRGRLPKFLWNEINALCYKWGITRKWLHQWKEKQNGQADSSRRAAPESPRYGRL